MSRVGDIRIAVVVNVSPNMSALPLKTQACTAVPEKPAPCTSIEPPPLAGPARGSFVIHAAVRFKVSAVPLSTTGAPVGLVCKTATLDGHGAAVHRGTGHVTFAPESTLAAVDTLRDLQAKVHMYVALPSMTKPWPPIVTE